MSRNHRIISLLLISIMIISLFCCTIYAEEEHEQLTNIPTLYIDLDGNKSVNKIEKDTYSTGTFSLVNNDKVEIDTVEVSIKGRGNSTWTLPKKPYQIKFNEKTDLLGMGASKKWILLANYWDKTLLRNYATYVTAQKMAHEGYFTPECQFVDLVVNGRYRGNYLLCEKIELDDERINVKFNPGNFETSGVLFEFETTLRHPHTGCPTCITTWRRGVHMMVKEPNIDENFTQKDMDKLLQEAQEWLEPFEIALKEGYDEFSQYIDVQSFIDWYILNELAKNYDAAFFTSCYCWKGTDGKIYMGPVWDVDVCFGNQDVYYPDTRTNNGLYADQYRANQTEWYELLFEDETFMRLLGERWQQLLDDGYIDDMLTLIDDMSVYLEESQKLDQEKWPDAMDLSYGVRDLGNKINAPVYYTYDEEIEYLKDYIKRRTEWLSIQWLTETGSDSFAAAKSSADMTKAKLAIKTERKNYARDFAKVGESEMNKFLAPYYDLPATFTYTFKEAVTVRSYGISFDSMLSPVSYTLEGSSDGENFTVLDSGSGIRVSDAAYCGKDIDNPGEYNTFRITFTPDEEHKDARIHVSGFAPGEYSSLDVTELSASLKTITTKNYMQLNNRNRRLVDTARAEYNALTDSEKTELSDELYAAFEEKEALINAEIAALPIRPKGDADGDGFVTLLDVLCAHELAKEEEILYYEDREASVLTGGDTVTYVDVLLILMLSLM